MTQLYISNSPKKLVMEASSIVDLYFDNESYPPCNDQLIVSKNGKDPSAMSVGASIIYHKDKRTLDGFKMVKKRDEYVAFKLIDEYDYLNFKVLALNSLAEARSYNHIIQYLLVHCVVKYDGIPDTWWMDRDISGAEYEVHMSRTNPYELFQAFFIAHMNEYKSEPDRDVPSILIRFKLLYNFITEYMTYVPS